ncbi:hypothetical protein [Micromonospora chokoriensis]|uniref:hypothetical protein n=1 Tax=Micromonospora chokoriensis TaxID=356851 RepID=UPI000B5B0CA3|nr:hypothetical protein [Micromonospora chokoriensis]
MTIRAARPADRPLSEQRGGFESTTRPGQASRPGQATRPGQASRPGQATRPGRASRPGGRARPLVGLGPHS